VPHDLYNSILSPDMVVMSVAVTGVCNFGEHLWTRVNSSHVSRHHRFPESSAWSGKRQTHKFVSEYFLRLGAALVSVSVSLADRRPIFGCDAYVKQDCFVQFCSSSSTAVLSE
jgi:hypothetical protein